MVKSLFTNLIPGSGKARGGKWLLGFNYSADALSLTLHKKKLTRGQLDGHPPQQLSTAAVIYCDAHSPQQPYTATAWQ